MNTLIVSYSPICTWFISRSRIIFRTLEYNNAQTNTVRRFTNHTQTMKLYQSPNWDIYCWVYTDKFWFETSKFNNTISTLHQCLVESINSPHRAVSKHDSYEHTCTLTNYSIRCVYRKWTYIIAKDHKLFTKMPTFALIFSFAFFWICPFCFDHTKSTFARTP